MTWKISPLLDFEIIGVFLNTLTADAKYPAKYPVVICQNLQFPIQV